MKKIIACIKNNKYYIPCKVTSWGFVPLMFFFIFLLQGGYQDLVERSLLLNVSILGLFLVPMLFVWLISFVFMLKAIFYACKNEHDENMYKTEKVTVSDLVNTIFIFFGMFFCILVLYRILLYVIVEMINYG